MKRAVPIILILLMLTALAAAPLALATQDATEASVPVTAAPTQSATEHETELAPPQIVVTEPHNGADSDAADTFAEGDDISDVEDAVIVAEEELETVPEAVTRTMTRQEIAAAETAAWSYLGAEEAFTGVMPALSSPSAILIERETGTVIFEQNADEIREPASVTKIMTILLVIEALESGQIALTDVVTTSAHAASMGGSQIYLKQNEKMTVHELLKAAVVNSANDAAVALGEHIAGTEDAFVALMNARAEQLGMTNTHFTNCSGLLESEEHRSTARDVATMSRELMDHPQVREYTTIWLDSLRGGATALVNTNKLVRFYDGATGLKTGYTSTAGHCLAATAERDGIEYIAVTLGEKSSAERFENAKAMLSYAFGAYTTVVARPDAALLPIPVELGRTQYIQPEVVGDERLLVTRADAAKLTKTVTIANGLLAPVAVGDELGTLTIKAGDEVLAELKIVAGQDSERLSWGEIYAEFVELLFVGATL